MRNEDCWIRGLGEQGQPDIRRMVIRTTRSAEMGFVPAMLFVCLYGFMDVCLPVCLDEERWRDIVDYGTRRETQYAASWTCVGSRKVKSV